MWSDQTARCAGSSAIPQQTPPKHTVDRRPLSRRDYSVEGSALIEERATQKGRLVAYDSSLSTRSRSGHNAHELGNIGKQLELADGGDKAGSRIRGQGPRGEARTICRLGREFRLRHRVSRVAFWVINPRLN